MVLSGTFGELVLLQIYTASADLWGRFKLYDSVGLPVPDAYVTESYTKAHPPCRTMRRERLPV